jgi:hypothetical protein
MLEENVDNEIVADRSETRSSKGKHALMRDLNFMSISKETFNVSMLSVENLRKESSRE